MDKEKTNKGIVVLLIIIIIILLTFCALFATNTISFSIKREQNTGTNIINSSNTIDDNITNNNQKYNIIVSENGKIISNSIPEDLSGKYVNENSNESYIELTNDNIIVSEPTGSGPVNVYKNDAIKLYINYLNTDYSNTKYITIEFYIENSKKTYTYIGQYFNNKLSFKTPDTTPVMGEGNKNYPYKKQ